MVTKDQAIAWIDNEIWLLERAPEVNGCEMTPEWAEALEVWRMARKALEQCGK